MLLKGGGRLKSGNFLLTSSYDTFSLRLFSLYLAQPVVHFRRLFSLWIFIVAVYRGICLCLHCETSSYIFLPFLLCTLMDSGENKRNFGVSRSVGLLLCNGDFREKQTPHSLKSSYNFLHICTTAIENLIIS